MVKAIGDAVMLRAPHAAAAVGLALALVEEVGQRHGHLTVRAGMHTGPAVERRGDWFGATRDTLRAIQDAGFEVERCERFGFSPSLVSPKVSHVLGVALRT